MKLYELDTNRTIANRNMTPGENRDSEIQLPSEFCRDRTWCEKGSKGKKIRKDESKIGRPIRKGRI